MSDVPRRETGHFQPAPTSSVAIYELYSPGTGLEHALLLRLPTRVTANDGPPQVLIVDGLMRMEEVIAELLGLFAIVSLR